ncbi:glycoside hydrolase family 3 protein [bacterium]|nr:MAG: glycoside hydrolase family 3 protein [bacterium]
MRTFIALFLFVIAGLSQLQCSSELFRNGEPAPVVALDTSWKSLTLREKIGQTMILTASHQLYKNQGFTDWKSFFEKYPVGGFFMARWTILDNVTDSLKRKTTVSLADTYQQNSKTPLFIVEDYEGGVGHNIPGFTKMPTGMAFGAANNPELTFEAGKAIARESRLLGFNWVLHPVADLNFNELNPVTNIRSVSSNPEITISNLKRQILELQENGVAATIKHFPGDGASDLDQHLTTTINSKTEAEWYATYGKTFKALINDGVYSIMMGHIAFPAYSKHDKETRNYPGTLSKAITTTLLKGEMGFQGVIVSDALNMSGIQGYYPNQLETEIACFAAGTDVMLWPGLAFMDSLEARINRGEFPMERLDDAVQRIWNLKKMLGLLDDDSKFEFSSEYEISVHEHAKKIAQEVADESVTLVKGKEKLPLNPEKDKNLLVVVVSPDKHENTVGELKTATDRLKDAGFNVDVRHNLSYYGNSPDDQRKYDKILFFYVRQPHNPIGSLQLQSEEALTAYMANMLPQDKVIGVSFGDPYVLSRYNPRISVRINAYHQIEVVQETVVDILLGKKQAKGVSPVKLSR